MTGATTLSSTLTTTAGLLSSVTTAAASASVSTTNVLTFPSAGAYLLLVSQCSGTTSSTPELIDNLTRVYMVIVSTLGTQTCQLYNLGNNSGYFSCSGSGQYTINLTVSLSSGQYVYRFFYQKLF